MILLISIAIILVVLMSLYMLPSLTCPIPNEKYCEVDSDCMCSTNPCFLGNRYYFENCIPDKNALGSCLDACGYGPYELDFRYICESNQCTFAVFNRTSGERVSDPGITILE